MNDIIVMNTYENIDSKELSKSIVAKLESGYKVTLDFKGIIEIDFIILENLIKKVLDSIGYEKIKRKFGFKNVTPKIRNSISHIIDVYLEER